MLVSKQTDALLPTLAVMALTVTPLQVSTSFGGCIETDELMNGP